MLNIVSKKIAAVFVFFSVFAFSFLSLSTEVKAESTLSKVYTTYIIEPGVFAIETLNDMFSTLSGGSVNLLANTSSASTDISFFDEYIINPLGNVFYNIFDFSVPLEPADPIVDPASNAINETETTTTNTPPQVVNYYTTETTETGARGATGERGPQGIQGPTGPRGPAGSDANFDTSNFVNSSFFENQVDGILGSIEDGIEGLSSSLSEEVQTALLNVSGGADLSGAVVIGSLLSGADKALVVNNNTSTGNIFEAQDGGTAVFTIADGGNVGIGTATPGAKLHVNNGSLKVVSNGAKFAFYEDDVAEADASFALSNATGAAGKFLPLLSMKSNVTTSAYANGIIADVTEDTPGQGPVFSFMARQNNSTVVNRDLFWFDNYYNNPAMVIKASGNVGIGTRASDKALEINSATGANMRLTYNDADGSAANYADLSTSSIGGLTITSAGTNPKTLVVNNNSITSTGNIFEAQDNGTAVFTIADGGNITSTGYMTASNSGYRMNSGNSGMLYGGSGLQFFTTLSNYGLFVNTIGVSTGANHSFSWTSGNDDATATRDTFLTREAAATIQMGMDVDGSAVDQTFKAHDGITGVNNSGANLTIAAGRGTGTGTGGSLIFQTAPVLTSGSTVQTLATRMTIEKDGDVGIGITAPTASLEIQKNTATTTDNALKLSNTTAVGGTALSMKNRVSIFDTESFRIFSSFTDGATYASGRTIFSTIDASGNPVNALTLDTPTASAGYGNVGINVTAPEAVLEVRGSATDLAALTLSNAGNAADDRTTLLFKSSAYNIGAAIKFRLLSGATQSNLEFHTTTGSVLGQKAVLTSDGNFGIGTTGPLSKLDVNGSVAIGTYAGTSAAPSNGLAVSGTVQIGTATAYNSEGLHVRSDNADATFPMTSPLTVTQGGSLVLENKNGTVNSHTGIVFSSATNAWGAGIVGRLDAINSQALDFYTASGAAWHHRMVIQGDGKVGIGTTAPQSLLDVQGPTGTGTATAGILTLATKELTIVDGDELGRINFNSPLESDGSDAILAGASIWAEADDTFSATVNSSELVFGTATTSAAIERMRIDSAGNVGIGTATPSYKLDISESTTDLEGIRVVNTNGSAGTATSAGILLSITNSAGSPKAKIQLQEPTVDSVPDLLFMTSSSSGASPTEKMRISGGGYVSIGGVAADANFRVNVGSENLRVRDSSGLQLYSADNNNSGWGALKIDATVLALNTSSGGTVGIGTTAPQSKLDVEGGVAIGATYSGTTAAPTNGLIVEGNVGVGTSTPGSNKLNVQGDVAAPITYLFNDGNATTREGLEIQAGADDASGTNTVLRFKDGDGTTQGTITFSGGTTAYNTSSDRRLKSNIVDTSFGLEELMNIEVKDFNFISDTENKLRTGFIAQDLYNIFPDVVTVPTNANDMWSVDYGKLTPLLTKSIQELNINLNAISGNITQESESFVTAFFENVYEKVGAWMANAGNSITRIFTGEVCLTEAGQESVCLNRTELQSLKALLNEGSTPSEPTPEPAPEPTPDAEPTPAETCSDDIQNQDETDIDTGGVCAIPEPEPEPTPEEIPPPDTEQPPVTEEPVIP